MPSAFRSSRGLELMLAPHTKLSDKAPAVAGPFKALGTASEARNRAGRHLWRSGSIFRKQVNDRRRDGHRQDVIHEQLKATLALVFVHIEAIDELYGAFGQHEGGALLDVI